MKYQIRKTGEIVEVISFCGDTRRTRYDSLNYIDSKGVEHNNEPLNIYWDLKVIEDEPKDKTEIDWESVRIQAAIAAMQGMNANPSIVRDVKEIPREAVLEADNLIRNLQRKS